MGQFLRIPVKFSPSGVPIREVTRRDAKIDALFTFLHWNASLPSPVATGEGLGVRAFSPFEAAITLCAYSDASPPPGNTRRRPQAAARRAAVGIPPAHSVRTRYSAAAVAPRSTRRPPEPSDRRRPRPAPARPPLRESDCGQHPL